MTRLKWLGSFGSIPEKHIRRGFYHSQQVYSFKTSYWKPIRLPWHKSERLLRVSEYRDVSSITAIRLGCVGSATGGPLLKRRPRTLHQCSVGDYMQTTTWYCEDVRESGQLWPRFDQAPTFTATLAYKMSSNMPMSYWWVEATCSIRQIAPSVICPFCLVKQSGMHMIVLWIINFTGCQNYKSLRKLPD